MCSFCLTLKSEERTSDVNAVHLEKTKDVFLVPITKKMVEYCVFRQGMITKPCLRQWPSQ